jgi:hypothetical protein
MPLRRCRPACASGSTSTSTRSSETLGSAGRAAARHDVIVAIDALARDDDQQSHRCQESAARARRSGTPRRRPREQRYRLHRKRATVSMPWLCSTRPLPYHKQRRIPCPVSNNQPTAVRTIASALQLEHSLRAQPRQEHHRGDRAARPQCVRERSPASGPALMSTGVCRRRSRQSPLARIRGRPRASRPSFTAEREFGEEHVSHRVRAGHLHWCPRVTHAETPGVLDHAIQAGVPRGAGSPGTRAIAFP